MTDETGDDSKRCGTEIKVLAEIGVLGIVKASVDFIMRNIKSEKKESNTGDYSAATIRAAHPVGSAQSGGKPGYVVSYRYGDYWHNHFYEGV